MFLFQKTQGYFERLWQKNPPNYLYIVYTDMESFWQSCLNQLKLELPSQQFNTWIKPLTPVDYKNGILHLAAPNRFKLDFVKNQFSARLIAIASKYWDIPVELKFSLQEKPYTKPYSILEPGLFDPESATRTPSPEEEAQKKALRNSINSEMTFDNFVTGNANQLARAAAIQVSINPGTSYNPLYIFGGVGLGKTHLMHAIANQILQNRPNDRIRCIHSERYVRDVVTASQRNSFDKLRQDYCSLDVLLIDDIQFLSGKNRTQDELFLVFETLTAERKQVIITGEIFPKELTGLHPRLISRFGSGLTVAIEPPELEMRVAILLKKAALSDVSLSNDVAFFIAQHLQSNIRELEGALKKVLAYSKFLDKDISIDLTKEALKDLLSVQNRLVSIDNIQKTVADFFNIKVSEMTSKQRPLHIVRPRQIAMYLAKELTQKSLPEIGKAFGGRDHTTVLHAVRKIADERLRDSECNREINLLEQTIKG